MRNCGCVDKNYFHTQRKGASGLQNMITCMCVSFGMHSTSFSLSLSLSICVSMLERLTYCIMKTLVKVSVNV